MLTLLEDVLDVREPVLLVLMMEIALNASKGFSPMPEYVNNVLHFAPSVIRQDTVWIAQSATTSITANANHVCTPAQLVR